MRSLGPIKIRELCLSTRIDKSQDKKFQFESLSSQAYGASFLLTTLYVNTHSYALIVTLQHNKMPN